MSTVSYPHIRIDDFGTANIGQTRYKVIHLAAITTVGPRMSCCVSIRICGPKRCMRR